MRKKPVPFYVGTGFSSVLISFFYWQQECIQVADRYFRLAETSKEKALHKSKDGILPVHISGKIPFSFVISR